MMEMRDIEDLVQESLWVYGLLKKLHRGAWDRLLGNQLKNVQQAGEMLRAVFEVALLILPKVGDCILGAERKGYTVAKTAEFEQAMKDLRHMNQHLLDQWPAIDAKQVEESRAAFARGEFQSAEDVVRELHRSDSGPH